jgi:hypothetical protein
MNAGLNANPTRSLQMKDKATLSITSLLSVRFFVLHWADDIVRGISTGGVSSLGGVLILVVWLYGTLVLGERRLGYIIMLLGSIFGSGVLVIHMRGRDLSAAGSPIPVESFSGFGAHRARRDLDHVNHPLGARPLGSATGPVPPVRWQPETRSRGCSCKGGAYGVIATAERLGADRILTAGERDSHAARSKVGKPFVILPADARG